jgi:hypothetical protein
MANMIAFFVTLNENQRFEINCRGWDCPAGKAYADMAIKRYEEDEEPDFSDVMEQDMFKMAAGGNFADLGNVFERLQNFETNWSESGDIIYHIDCPRSMCVGDVIWNKDTDQYFRVASIGFTDIKNSKFKQYLNEKHEIFIKETYDNV